MGDGREAQVPALLEMLRIPYTASRVLANAVGLDKTMTKRIWRDHGIPTAPFQEFTSGFEPLDAGLEFPLFVKPAREGTGMGMDEGSIVRNEAELRERVNWVIRILPPARPGRNLPARARIYRGRAGPRRCRSAGRAAPRSTGRRLPPLPHPGSRQPQHHHPGRLRPQGQVAPLWRKRRAQFPLPGRRSSPNWPKSLSSLAIRAHQAIGALDVSRVDVRLDEQGRPHLLEINTLPGLTPGFSDLCVIAAAEGLSYTDLILEILYLGASRFGLLKLTPQPVRVPVRMRGHKVSAMPLLFE